MYKPRALTFVVSVAFLLTLVSSVRADSVHVPPGQQKLNLTDFETLSFPDVNRVDLSGLIAEHFANNNGRHLGFSVAAFHGGMKLGLEDPPSDSSIAQNPEPTGMLLLGTGLAAVAAFARRRSRRRRHL